ncbi:MAG: hypothetical protein KatS3mg057_2752 [Herpetosiphonaceae bacterium]|nr:MAG: hypothetical protein KatS3mg057_2752 [Herpetosiphonaceae bacterium]
MPERTKTEGRSADEPAGKSPAFVHNEPAKIFKVQADSISRVLLESAPDAIIIVDDHGRIVMVNTQAERWFGYDRQELVGQPIEILIPEQLRAIHERHRAGYTAEPRTRPMGVGLDLIARRKDGSQFPAEISLSPVRTDSGLLITAVIRDITERKRAEAVLQQKTGFVQLLQAAAVAANEATTIEEALQFALDLICAHTGWPIGHVYLLSESPSRALRSMQIWHLDSRERFHIFCEISEKMTFAPGVGLPGRVLVTGKPGWIEDVTQDPEFLRAEAAIACGLRSAYAFPVLAGAEVAGVLEFFSGEAVIPDAPLLDVMANISTQLGRVVERRRAAEELERQVQRRTAHLNALLQFSSELLLARSLDAVLQRSISHAMALVPDAQRGAIYLYDAAGDQLALRASAGFDQLPQMRIPVDLGFIGITFTRRRPCLCSSTVEFELIMPESEECRRMMRALGLETLPTGAVAFPLLAHNTAVGVLLLLRERGDGPFAVESQSTLEGLANLTAAAILEERSRHEAATLSTQLASLEEQQRRMAERLSLAEVSMLQTARLAAMGQLAASIAHEINNPLYAARNAVFLLEEDVPPELRNSPYLTMAREQLDRIARIIERMRNFYRPSRGDLAPCNLNQILEETLELAGLNLRHGSIKMIFTPAPDLPMVLSNGDQLRQVFLNLILNAIEAMPDGGTLTVRTESRASFAVVEVQDTGIGIPAELRSRIFEPFFTSKPGGTGLGLAISAHIVTQHGGRIEVESEEGQGTTFRVILPYESIP